LDCALLPKGHLLSEQQAETHSQENWLVPNPAVEVRMVNNGPTPETMRIIRTRHDGSSRDEWPAQLVEERGAQLRVYVPAGTEEVVRGHRHQVMHIPSTGLFWTDRWYDVWQLDQTEGELAYCVASRKDVAR
jgi:hypothetical protein